MRAPFPILPDWPLRQRAEEHRKAAADAAQCWTCKCRACAASRTYTRQVRLWLNATQVGGADLLSSLEWLCRSVAGLDDAGLPLEHKRLIREAKRIARKL